VFFRKGNDYCGARSHYFYYPSFGTLGNMRYRLLLFMLLECHPSHPPSTSTPEWCALAESNLEHVLNCPDGRGGRLGAPNKKGQPFQEVCRNLYADGVDFRASCLAQAKTCAEVETCRP